MNGAIGCTAVPRTICALISSLRELEPISYLPIKIKMPAMSAKTPITIAPMPM